MIIQLLEKIPIKIYLYIILFCIIIFGIIGIYAYFNYELNSVQKSILIWYMAILEINFIHLYFILKFYQSNLNKKGESGDQGETGPRGFKGEGDMCRACGNDGAKKIVYAGTVNDNGTKNYSDKVVEGRCQFPFIDNYKYNYECVKNNENPDGNNDAQIYGWCATKVNEKKEPVEFGYCNENRSIAEKNKNQERYLKNRKQYLQNNNGIIDLKLVEANTRRDAEKQCNNMPGGGYELHEQDLNEASGGKFIYMCYKKGLNSKGISDLRVIIESSDKVCSQIPNTICNSTVVNDNDNGKKIMTACKLKNNSCEGQKNITEINQYSSIGGMSGYKIVTNNKGTPINLNQDSGDKSNKTKLYLFSKKDSTGFIKDIKVDTTIKCSDGYRNPGFINNYIESSKNLNYKTNGKKLNLCITNTTSNIISIDTAFVYKDNNLYVFRGNQFFKINSKAVNNIFKVSSGFPKDISEKWFKKTTSSKFADEEKKNVKNSRY